MGTPPINSQIGTSKLAPVLECHLARFAVVVRLGIGETSLDLAVALLSGKVIPTGGRIPSTYDPANCREKPVAAHCERSADGLKLSPCEMNAG